MKRVLAGAAVLLLALGAGCAVPASSAPGSAADAGEAEPLISAPVSVSAAGEAEPPISAPVSAPAEGEVEPPISAAEVEEELRARLEGMSPTEAAGMKDGWKIPGWAVYCAGAAEVPEEAVLACQWGKGYNVMHDGRVLFWREGGEWRSQPYPPDGVVGVGDFHGLRREGDLVQVVMNVGGGQTRHVAQVGLLAYDGGQWRPVWGPEPPESDSMSAVVFEPSDGIDRYTRFLGLDGGSYREDWERDGARYVLRHRIELTPEESFVVEFARGLLSDPDWMRWRLATAGALDEALQLDLPARLREGFTAESVGDREVLLEAEGSPEAWVVTVVEAEGRKMVTAIRPASQ